MPADSVKRVSLPTVAQSYAFRKNPDLGNLDELEKTIKVFKQNLDFDLEHFQSAKALPSEFYSEQIWKALRVMLRQNWLAVGHVKDLTKPFDYFTVNFAAGPLLVINDEEGKTHAFKNRCTHEKKIIVTPPEYPEKGNLSEVERLENKEMLKCFYHGMKFKIDDKSPLTKYVVDKWGPLVFVFMQDLRDKPEQIEIEKERLHTMLAPLDEITKDMDIASFQMGEEWNDPMKCHFGIYDGNYCDANHLRDTHPKLAESLILSKYICQFFNPASLQSCPLKESSSDVRGGMAYYFKLPPTAAVNIYKQNRDRSTPLSSDVVNNDVIDTNIVRPIDRKNTIVTFGFHFPPGSTQAIKNDYIAGSKRIQNEDQMVCTSTQLGVESDLEGDRDDYGYFMRPEVLKFAFQKWMVKELEKIIGELKKNQSIV